MPPIFRAWWLKLFLSRIGDMKESFKLLKLGLCHIKSQKMKRSILLILPPIMINLGRSMYPHIDQYIKEYLDLGQADVFPSSRLDNEVFKLHSFSFGIGICGLTDCFQDVLDKKQRE